jgi:LysM repeat protein
MLLEDEILTLRGDAMIKISDKGDFRNTERFLTNAQKLNTRKILESYGWKGVQALSVATPKDTGETSNAWEYDVKVSTTKCSVTWYNTNLENNVPVAILIQYGHGTKNGGYVQGIDYINPALKPIFDQIAEALWSEVQNLWVRR